MRKNEEKKEFNNIPDFNLVGTLSQSYCDGFDFLSDEEVSRTVPSFIEHDTARLSVLYKPFIKLTSKSTPTVSNYYNTTNSLLIDFVERSFEECIEYNIHSILHKYYQLIGKAIMESCIKNKINYDPTKILESLCLNTINIKNMVLEMFNIVTINKIEQMYQLYSSLEVINGRKTEYNFIDDEIFKAVTMPYVHSATTSITYSMYNTTVSNLYYFSLRESLLDKDRAIIELGELEKDLFKVFVYIHDQLNSDLTLLIGNLMMTKTVQSSVPELKDINE